MKKRFISLFLMATLLLSTTSLVFADDYIDDIPDNAHKVLHKWDFAGSLTSERGQIGKIWYYEVHIKQAVYGPYSKGVILFSSGDDYITAHVEDVKEDYYYWAKYTKYPNIADNLAAVGWAEYNGDTYYFMFLYSDGGVWIVLSNTPYSSYWNVGNVYQGAEDRVHQVLSTPWVGSGYPMDPKF